MILGFREMQLTKTAFRRDRCPGGAPLFCLIGKFDSCGVAAVFSQPFFCVMETLYGFVPYGNRWGTKTSWKNEMAM